MSARSNRVSSTLGHCDRSDRANRPIKVPSPAPISIIRRGGEASARSAIDRFKIVNDLIATWTRRKSRRDRHARGSSGASESNNSGST